MLLTRVLRSLFVASGALILVAGAAVLSTRKHRQVRSRGCSGRPESASSPEDLSTRRDYFSITRTRSKDVAPQWLLQGFGRYQCFLFFDTWQQAMNQASFQLDRLASHGPDLVRIATPFVR